MSTHSERSFLMLDCLTQWTEWTNPRYPKNVDVGSGMRPTPNLPFIYVNDANTKTVSNVPVGSPEYEMINASNIRWVFLLPAITIG